MVLSGNEAEKNKFYNRGRLGWGSRLAKVRFAIIQYNLDLKKSKSLVLTAASAGRCQAQYNSPHIYHIDVVKLSRATQLLNTTHS
jgi:hypothetical protein